MIEFTPLHQVQREIEATFKRYNIRMYSIDFYIPGRTIHINNGSSLFLDRCTLGNIKQAMDRIDNREETL